MTPEEKIEALREWVANKLRPDCGTFAIGEAAFWARREGFAQGWKLRGLQGDVLAFRHMTRDKKDDS